MVLLAVVLVLFGVDAAVAGDRTVSGEVAVTTLELPDGFTFEVSQGEESFTREDLDRAAAGELVVSFYNHVGTEPPVPRVDVCPGNNNGQKLGVRVWFDGLSVGTQVDARLVTGGQEIARWSGYTGGTDPLHVRVCHKP